MWRALAPPPLSHALRSNYRKSGNNSSGEEAALNVDAIVTAIANANQPDNGFGAPAFERVDGWADPREFLTAATSSNSWARDATLYAWYLCEKHDFFKATFHKSVNPGASNEAGVYLPVEFGERKASSSRKRPASGDAGGVFQSFREAAREMGAAQAA